MMISTKGRYAMRLMVDVAVNAQESPVSLKDVAQREHMPLKYLEQLVRSLTRNELLRSVRGQHGEASSISAGDILRAAEGTTAPVACLDGSIVDCPRMETCTTLSFWQGLDKAIESYVDGVTLADLARPYLIEGSTVHPDSPDSSTCILDAFRHNES